MKPSDKILKAKIKLQKTSPFFAYLVMNLKIIEKEEIESMAVDNKGNCYYSPSFVEGLTNDEVEGVLCHEVMHIVLEHLIRGNGLELPLLMNVATDMCVNDLLKENKFSLPSCNGGALIPTWHSCDFMGVTIDDINKKTAIQIYHELLKKLKSKDKIKYKGGFDEHICDEKGKEKNEVIEQQKEKWKDVVGEASAFARTKGELPKGLELMIDDLLNEKVDWKAMLYKYITKTLPFDYTYARPSKKSVSCGVYMPSILRESVEIVVSIDTSGSIQKGELTEFMTEINAIAKSFNNLNMKLIVCDYDVKDVYEIGNGSDEEISKIILRGGGGTSHIPVYEYVKQNLPNTQFIINFTDGWTDFPDDEQIKTLWVLCKDGACSDDYLKWGEIIRLS